MRPSTPQATAPDWPAIYIGTALANHTAYLGHWLRRCCRSLNGASKARSTALQRSKGMEGFGIVRDPLLEGSQAISWICSNSHLGICCLGVRPKQMSQLGFPAACRSLTPDGSGARWIAEKACDTVGLSVVASCELPWVA